MELTLEAVKDHGKCRCGNLLVKRVDLGETKTAGGIYVPPKKDGFQAGGEAETLLLEVIQAHPKFMTRAGIVVNDDEEWPPPPGSIAVSEPTSLKLIKTSDSIELYTVEGFNIHYWITPEGIRYVDEKSRTSNPKRSRS